MYIIHASHLISEVLTFCQQEFWLNLHVIGLVKYVDVKCRSSYTVSLHIDTSGPVVNYTLHILKTVNNNTVIFVGFFPRSRFSPGASVLLVPKCNVFSQIDSY